MAVGEGRPGEPGSTPEADAATLARRLELAERALAEKEVVLRGLRDELEGIHRMRWWKLASLYWGLLGRFRRSRRPVEGPGSEEPSAWPGAADASVATRSVPGSLPEGADPGARKLAERFARYRERGKDSFFLGLARHLSPLADAAVVDMYFEFAITANERGRDVARRMERFGPLSGKTTLDIGCACGGFVVAFSEAGAKATGMDSIPRS